MYYRSRPTLTRLTRAGNAIELALADHLLSEKLASVGFGESELEKGLSYQREVLRLHSEKYVAHGNKKTATQALKEIASEVRAKLLIDRHITDTVLPESAVRKLGITGKTPESYAPLQKRASHFYKTILREEHILTVLVDYNFTRDSIDNRLKRVHEMAEAMKTQKIRIGEAQVTTFQLNQALHDMDEWMSEFIQAARFAFRKEPKQLKKLGIHTRK